MPELADWNVLRAFLLTLFAGLSTGLGSFVVLWARKPSLRWLSFGLGFSGGVMVFVSLAELLPQAEQKIGSELVGWGKWVAYGFFFGGILFSWLLDLLVPAPENPHEMTPVGDLDLVAGSQKQKRENNYQSSPSSRSLARVGIFTVLAITIHNFPEGMATLVSSISDATLGLSVAIAVAIHNIPEGISVAVLVFFATNNKKKAALYSFISGLAEPLGAIVVYLLLAPYINGIIVGGMLATVGGIMVYVSFDELLPTAREYGKGHTEILGIILGMAVMAASLGLFG